MSEILPQIKKIKIADGKPKHKIAIFGGSFNPPHIGHVLAVQYVKSTTDFEGIFVIPCGNHAFGKNLLPFEHRLKMCQLAFFNHRQPINEFDGIGYVQNNIVVSDIENTDEISYAIDTARRLKTKLEAFKEGEIELYWIVGTDCAKEVDKWKNIEELKKLVTFHEVPRAETKFTFDLRSVLPCISSTEVRKRISEGKNVGEIVPRLVLDYIDDNKLYIP